MDEEARNTREICDMLVNNDPLYFDSDMFKVPTLFLEGFDDNSLHDIFKALKQNTTVEMVYIQEPQSGEMGARASLELASALSQHSKINCLCLNGMDGVFGFSAIALAFQQNENLSELGLYSCHLSISQMEELEWMLSSSNAIEDLEIHCCYPENDLLHIPRGLHSNQSLRKLSLENVEGAEDEYPWSISDETLLAIPSLFRRNQRIQKLHLSHVAIPSEVLAQISEAAAGHVSLTELSLVSVGADGSNSELAPVLASNTCFKTMNLPFNRIGDAGAIALSVPLQHNTNVEVLHLGWNRIGSEGAAALANGLRSNTALKELAIHYNPIGDTGADALAHALTANTTLKELRVGGFGEAGLNAFAACLPRMRGLKKLSIRKLSGLTYQCTSTFVKAMERNTELEDVYLYAIDDSPIDAKLVAEIMPKVRFQTVLNKGGKRILKSERIDVPDSLWPRILARSSTNPDVLFFFLREKPDVLINKPPLRASRKRKRGWLSSLFS